MPNREQGMLEGMKEGFGYVWASPAIRSVLGLLGLVNLMSMPTTILLPLVAIELLHGGADTLGFLTAALGIGALAASLFLAARRSVLGLGRLIAWTTGAFGFGMIVLSFSHLLWLSVLALLGTGFAMIAQMAASNTILQTIVEEDKRGRLMGFYTLAFVGTAPLGSLLSGFLASRIGTTATILLCGLFCVGGSLVFAYLLPGLRKAVRPIYVRAGILKEVAGQTEPPSEGLRHHQSRSRSATACRSRRSCRVRRQRDLHKWILPSPDGTQKAFRGTGGFLRQPLSRPPLAVHRSSTSHQRDERRRLHVGDCQSACIWPTRRYAGDVGN